MDQVQRQPLLSQQALEQIRNAVVVGSLEAGSMHSEQSIAARLGLSRTPVREALLQLVNEGLVAFEPNRGVRIAEFDPEHLAQVLQFRAAIEGCGASRMAAKAHPGRLELLESMLHRQREIVKLGDRLKWVAANMDFHIILAESSENDLMVAAYASLASHTTRLGYRMNYRLQRMQESLDEHSAIVDAIKRGDSDRARTMAEDHLYITTLLMKQLFADLGISSGAVDSGLKKKRGRNATLA